MPLASLQDLKLVQFQSKRHIGSLAVSYTHVFLKQVSESDSRLLCCAMQQVLGPLDRPRYVIPRHLDLREQTFFSKVLPEVAGKSFVKTNRILARLHTRY